MKQSFHESPLHQDCQLHSQEKKKQQKNFVFFSLYTVLLQNNMCNLQSILAFKTNQNLHTIILTKVIQKLQS